MGFNLSGIAINKNFENDFENLQKELGWKLEKESEINFETASSNWKDENICDVYFSENGTILFLNMDMCSESYNLKDANTLTFAISESSMAFNLNYSENGIEKRSIMEINGDKIQDEGEKLEIELNSKDISEIIWNQIEIVLKQKFWNIEPSQKAIRYIFKNNAEIKIEKISSEYNLDMPISKEDLSTKFSDSELFKSFDEIIEFAQHNKINIFIYPWAHKENSRMFMNLFAIISEIEKRNNLSNEIEKRMPLERFKMICKFNPDNVDSKTNLKMLQQVNQINFKSNNLHTERDFDEKKWWQFWR